jgi:polycomb protein EED
MGPVKVDFVFNRVIQEERRKGSYLKCTDGFLASVGGNKALVYRINADSTLELIRSIVDEDEEELYYACEWSYNTEPLLAVGGLRGIVKVVNIVSNLVECCLIGHGNAVNEIKVHPVDQNLLLSGSKDTSIRLWNIKTGLCVAIFCGLRGHKDEILGVDVHPLGNCFVSCGMDAAIKIWGLDTSFIRSLVRDSYERPEQNTGGKFIQLPDYSTSLVHRNYVDDVHWIGNLLLTNAVSEKISLWAPDPSQNEV